MYLYLNLPPLFFFFFFQAEDGIRDLTVTGVQTCALPISPPDLARWRRERFLRRTRRTKTAPGPRGRPVGGPTSDSENRFPLKKLRSNDTCRASDNPPEIAGGKPYVAFRSTGRGGRSGPATI